MKAQKDTKIFKVDYEDRVLSAYLKTSPSENVETLNVFFKDLDEANLRTNLFSVMTSKHIRNHASFNAADEDFATFESLGLEDIIPMIGKKSREGVKEWIYNWDVFFKLLYSEVDKPETQKNYLTEWYNKPNDFISKFGDYIKAPEILNAYADIVKKDLLYLVKMREKRSVLWDSKVLELWSLLSSRGYSSYNLYGRDRSCYTLIKLLENIHIENINLIILINPNNNQLELLNQTLDSFKKSSKIPKIYLLLSEEFNITSKLKETCIIKHIDKEVKYVYSMSKYLRESEHKAIEEIFKDLNKI